MAGLTFVRLVAVTAALAVAGCEGGPEFPGFGRSAGTADAPVEGGEAASGTVATDVEAPEVFSVEEAGLWDGRPSLGGVWVAHPDVKDPERVLIRNTVSGQSVVGALFRRERDNPGPRLQASSDAAEALGLLAGQPATLEVVALRRESVPVAPPAASDAPAPAAAGAVETAKIEATPLAPVPRRDQFEDRRFGQRDHPRHLQRRTGRDPAGIRRDRRPAGPAPPRHSKSPTSRSASSASRAMPRAPRRTCGRRA